MPFAPSTVAPTYHEPRIKLTASPLGWALVKGTVRYGKVVAQHGRQTAGPSPLSCGMCKPSTTIILGVSSLPPMLSLYIAQYQLGAPRVFFLLAVLIIIVIPQIPVFFFSSVPGRGAPQKC